MAGSYAVVLLYDSKKRVLLRKSPSEQWTLLGGGVLEKETPKGAARRECSSGLAYPLLSPRLVLVHASRDAVKHVFVERYDDTKQLLSKDGRELRWADPLNNGPLPLSVDDRELLDFLQGSY